MKVVALKTIVEMASPSQARLTLDAAPGLTVTPADKTDAAAYRDLYREVGRDHLWVARTRWTVDDYGNRIADGQVHVWLARVDGEPVGFIEFEEQEDGTIEIKFLGVSPRFMARGIGKYLLSFGIREAWKLQPEKLWLFTRNYDGEHALTNYIKRGFVVKKIRSELIGVSKENEEAAAAVVRRARERGDYPGLLRRIEAHIRDSRPGDFVRDAVYRLRRRLRRARQRT